MVAASPHRLPILDCMKMGLSNAEIAKKLKVHHSLVYRTVTRYQRLGTLEDKPRCGRPTTVTTSKAVKKVRSIIRRNAARSMRKMAKEMGMSEKSMRRIVKNKLKMVKAKGGGIEKC